MKNKRQRALILKGGQGKATHKTEPIKLIKWSEFSSLICAANGFPNGFRVALVCDGRVMRSDLKVRIDTSQIGSYPDDWRVWALLEQFMEEDVLELNPDLIYDDIVLFDERGIRVGDNRRVFEIRELDEDQVDEARTLIEEKLEEMTEEFDSYGEPGQRLVAKAVVQALFFRFDSRYIAFLLKAYMHKDYPFKLGGRYADDQIDN